jgi:hypothetical protein
LTSRVTESNHPIQQPERFNVHPFAHQWASSGTAASGNSRCYQRHSHSQTRVQDHSDDPALPSRYRSYQ